MIDEKDIEEEQINELHENIWALISERGCEALDVSYDEAYSLMRKLADEKVFGLAVVTSKTARRDRVK